MREVAAREEFEVQRNGGPKSHGDPCDHRAEGAEQTAKVTLEQGGDHRGGETQLTIRSDLKNQLATAVA